MVAGIAVALPANRMTGIYLAIATLAFSQIVEQVVVRWESVTRGFQGMPVPPPDIFGQPLTHGLGVLLSVPRRAGRWWCSAPSTCMRSPTGRAMVAIRDSEISAQSLGVNLVRYKTIAFALSACITGLAGALLAHKLKFISPDAFNILLSIQLLLMVVVGGLGSIHGAIYGAIFVGGLPQAIALMRDYLPPVDRQDAGPGARPVRPGHDPDRAVRAARHLRPLAEDRAYLRLFPALPARTFKRGRSSVPRIGARHRAGSAAAMTPASPLRADLSIAFGGIRAVDGVTFDVKRARSSPSSAPTAPARAPSST